MNPILKQKLDYAVEAIRRVHYDRSGSIGENIEAMKDLLGEVEEAIECLEINLEDSDIA